MKRLLESSLEFLSGCLGYAQANHHEACLSAIQHDRASPQAVRVMIGTVPFLRQLAIGLLDIFDRCSSIHL